MKNKILKISLSTAAIAAVVTPIATLTSCNKGSVVDPVVPVTPEQEKIFNIKDNTLYGFKDGVTQQQVNEYIKNGVFKLPAVKTIAANAFNSETASLKINATTIDIANSTSVIEDKAYFAQKDLTTITWAGAEMPSDDATLHTIGESAFAFCTGLTSFAFPKTLYTDTDGQGIKKAAFFGCSSLNKLEMTNYLKYDFVPKPNWAFGAFAGTAATGTLSFEHVDAPAAGTTWSRLVYAGMNPAWDAKKSSYSFYSKYKEIPQEYLLVDNNVFKGANPYFWPETERNFDVVKIPAGVTSIDPTLITSNFFVNRSVDDNDKGVFCWNFTDTLIEEMPANIFKDVKTPEWLSKTYITIPATIKTIGANAFKNCKYVIHFKGTDNLTTINDNAFDCSSLYSLVFKKTLTTVGNQAFANCDKLYNIDFTPWGISDSLPAWSGTEIFKSSGLPTGTSNTVKLSNNLASDPIGQFELQDKFDEFLTGHGLTFGSETGKWKFYPDALEPITYEQLFNIDNNGCLSGWAKSKGGVELTAKQVGKILTKLGKTGTLTIPANVKYIADNAFWDDNASKTKIPSEVTGIAFAEDSLCTDIGENVFKNATSLTSVSIPKGISQIEDNAFNGCSNLATIDLSTWEVSSLPAWTGATSFSGVASAGTVKVKQYNATSTSATELDQWRLNSKLKTLLTTLGITAWDATGANGWKFDNADNATPYKIVDGTIKGWAVGGVTSATALSEAEKKALMLEKYALNDGLYIPKTVTAIDDYAFIESETSLVTTIPSTMVKLEFENGTSCSIGNKSFYGAPFTDLSNNTFVYSVTSIGDLAFAYSQIVSLKLPTNVTSIGEGAFYGIDTLTTLTIPKYSSDVTIGALAFANNSALASIVLEEGYTAADLAHLVNTSKNMLDNIATTGHITCSNNEAAAILSWFEDYSITILSQDWTAGE